MSKRRIVTPVNLKLTTNVAVVRMKKGGHRFEIACYKNKVVSWRQKVETDLSEVLQSEEIFVNVSKGQFAKEEDLQSSFPSLSKREIMLLILDKGELQISPKERDQQYEQAFKEIAQMVSYKCLNPITSKPYTSAQIEKAMKDAHIHVNIRKGTKQQALEAIKNISSVLKIERAKMRLLVRVNYPKHLADVKKHFGASFSLTKDIASEDVSGDFFVEKEDRGEGTMIVLVDPGQYRDISDFVTHINGGGSIEIMDSYVRKVGDMRIDEMELKEFEKASTGDSKSITGSLEDEEDKDEEEQDDVSSEEAKLKGGHQSKDVDDDEKESSKQMKTTKVNNEEETSLGFEKLNITTDGHSSKQDSMKSGSTSKKHKKDKGNPKNKRQENQSEKDDNVESGKEAHPHDDVKKDQKQKSTKKCHQKLNDHDGGSDFVGDDDDDDGRRDKRRAQLASSSSTSKPNSSAKQNKNKEDDDVLEEVHLMADIKPKKKR